MKLGELERLLARLALKMQSPQLNQLRFSCSELTEAQKMEAQSPIKLFTILKRKSKSNEQFVSTLEQHFEGIQDFEDLSTIVQDFRSENPDPNSIKPLKGPILPNGAFAFRPGREQSHHFKRMLLNVSNSLNWIHLEIMVAISPIPDSLKEHMNKGYQLFEELKRHGCISENDTEFLDDVFTLLNLQTPLELLQSYQRQYPQTIFPEPSPSAPTFATPPSSLQASYSSPSEGSPPFLSLPTHYSPVETSEIGGSSPHQPPSLPHQVSTYPQTTPHAHWQHDTYPRPLQTTSPQSQTPWQHETYPRPLQTTSPQSRTPWQHETYPRPLQTTSPQLQRNTYPQTVATSGTSASLHPNQQPVQVTTTRCRSPEFPYPTTKSLDERRKRQLGERGGDQSPDPSEEQPPAVKRTRDIDSLSTPSVNSYASSSQFSQATPSQGSSNYSSPLPSYSGSGYEFPSGISESRGSGQEGERRRLEQHETGHHRFPALSQTKSALSHHDTHLTDKERLVYGGVPRSDSHSTEESGERWTGRLVGSHGSLRSSNVPRARSVLTHSEIHATPSLNPEATSSSAEESGERWTGRLVGSQGSLRSSNVPRARSVLTHSEIHATPSLNLEATSSSAEESGERWTGRLVGSHGSLRSSNVPRARSVLTHSEIHATPSLNLEATSSSAEESGERWTGRLVGSHGSLRSSNVPPAHSVLTHSEIHATPSLNLEAKSSSAEESGERWTGRLVGSHGSLRSSNVPRAHSVLTHSEIHATPSSNLPVERQPSIRPPSDIHPGPEIPQYARAQGEETYTQPTESTAGENGELAMHKTSSGNPVRQASSQSNIAVENFDDPEPRNYIYPQHQPFLSDQFVSGLRPSSFGTSLGSSFLVAGTGTSYPTGSSLATSDLLSSESSGPGSSYQASTMPSRPSLASVEEEQSEEEEEEREEEDEETWLKKPKLARSASSAKRRKSSPPAEEQEEQPKSWASSLFSLPKKVVSGVWNTFSGSTQEKKEEDSDNSFESCKDDEGSSSD